ncbi:MAG: DUF177 domain-containing protein [Thermodesulfobacteriota bacterium]
MAAPRLSVNVASIKETGLDLPLELGEDWFSRWQEEDPDLEFAGPGSIQVKLRVEKHGRDILLRGHLKGRLELQCSRCLTPFAAPVEADFDLLLVPGPEPVTAEPEELTATDLDLDFYTGEVVDLEAILREQILLLLPLKPLCAESCRGLCPHCGADLNQETCACGVDKSSSPFAALAKLKI